MSFERRLCVKPFTARGGIEQLDLESLSNRARLGGHGDIPADGFADGVDGDEGVRIKLSDGAEQILRALARSDDEEQADFTIAGFSAECGDTEPLGHDRGAKRVGGAVLGDDAHQD